MTQIVEFIDTDSKTLIITIFYMCKVGKLVHVKQKHRRYEKTQIKLLERKNTLSELKDTADGTNSRSDNAEEKISLFKQ